MAANDQVPPQPVRDLQACKRAVALLRPERGRALFVSLAGVALAGMQVVEPILFGRSINRLAAGESPLRLILIWCAVSTASFLAGVLISVLADRMSHRCKMTAMSAYLDHVLTLPSGFHSQAKSGRLMRIMISGCETLFGIWLPFFREKLTSMVSLLVLVPVALWMNWRLATVLITLMAIYVAANIAVMRRTSKMQADVEGQYTEVSGRIGDLLGNVPVLQSFLAVPGELRQLRAALRDALEVQFPVLNWWALLTVLTRAASSISVVAIFAVGAYLAGIGAATIGDIVAFIGFAGLVIGRLDQVTGFFNGMFMRLPALVQFFDVLDARSEIVEKPNASPLRVTSGHVVFDNVSFRYPQGSGAIRNLSFEAKPGETVAVVGPTGSGKSTTLSLLQRAYDPERGRIMIDGQDIRDATLPSLRQSIGIVFQEAGLFNRTIAENIALGRPGATQSEIEEAARLAGAHDFIVKRPGGYQSMIGERGSGLSGGERQRLAIARAILKNAPILVLDEATSALDVRTEAKLQDSLDRLRSGRTTFVIAHRLSTVRSADRIIVLDGGAIAEVGGFDELVARGGLFAQMVRDGGLAEQKVEAAPRPAPLHALAA